MKYNVEESKAFEVFKSFVDVAIVILGYYISFYIRYGRDIQSRNIEPFFTLMPFIVIISCFFFYIYLSNNNADNSYIDLVYSSILAIGMIQIITIAMSFFARGFAFPRSVFAISFFVQVALILVWKKLLFDFYSKYQRKNRVLFVGENRTNSKVAQNMMRMKRGIIEFAGEVMPEALLNNGFDYDFDSICITSSVDIYSRDKILEMAVAKNKTIYILPDFYEIILSSSKLSQFDDMPIFKIRHLSLSTEQQTLKRIIDLLLVVPGLIFVLPFMIVAGIMIKSNDKGPIFYKQERLTAGGKKFELIKFRTMRVNAEGKTGPVLAGTDDPRITKAGKFLRASRLDELPQLFNVLKGEMSIVGPRPEREFFYKEFEKEIPQFRYRLSLKAGITGLGQILGKYTTSPEDKLTYDLLYAYDYTILLDIKIIFQTLRIMLKKTSSNGVKK